MTRSLSDLRLIEYRDGSGRLVSARVEGPDPARRFLFESVSRAACLKFMAQWVDGKETGT